MTHLTSPRRRPGSSPRLFWLPAFAGMTALLPLYLVACKFSPTYKSSQVAGDLKKMVAHDYKMKIETRRAENSLQASFWRVGMLKPGQLDLQPEVAEGLERVLLCATRISLSTDAPLQFLEVKMVDALTGGSVKLWRFVPDIRDSMYTRLPEDEYLNRLVIEFNTDSNLDPKEWKEVQWDPPITMAEFLAKQVVLRVKRQSTVSVQAHEDVSHPSTLVVVLDNWAVISKQGAKQQDKVTELMEKTAKTVVHGYRYKGFREFVLKDPHGMALRSWAL